MNEAFLEKLRQLSSNIGHDLKAPLRAINFYSEMLKEDFEEELPEEATEYLKKVVQSASRLDLLHKELHYSSKALISNLQPEELNLADLIQSIGIENGLSEISIQGDLSIKSSNFLVKEIFTELIQNVKIHAGEQAAISIELRLNNDNAKVSFKDDGLGIGNTIELKDLFIAGSKSSANPQCYGLYFVRRICEMLGGSITHDEQYTSGFKMDLIF